MDDNWIINKIAGLAARWSSHRIRFGGVVGKLTYISVAAISAVTIILFSHGTDWLRAFAIAVVGIFAIFVVHRVLGYAQQHPEATLEGSEILTWQQQLLGAKGLANPPSDSKQIAAPLHVESPTTEVPESL